MFRIIASYTVTPSSDLPLSCSYIIKHQLLQFIHQAFIRRIYQNPKEIDRICFSTTLTIIVDDLIFHCSAYMYS